MTKLQFKDLINLDYKYIFDYFDMPLSFIGEINKKNYLFYYVDETTFFVVELTFSLANKLSEYKNLTRFFSEILLDDNKLIVIYLDYGKEVVEYINPDLLENDLSYYLPKSNSIIDYDYHKNEEIAFDYDLTSNLEFPLESKNITLRVTDTHESSIYKVSTIEKITKFISNSFETIKERTSSQEELFLAPYAPGSFKINFLVKQDELDLFGDNEKVSLSSLINILIELNYSGKESLNLDLVKDEKNIELIQYTSEIYNELKNEQISLQFYKEEIDDNNYLARLSPNPITDNNISVFNQAIHELKSTTIEVKNETKHAKLLAGSLIYNRATILIDEEQYRVKFDQELFRKIKSGETRVNLDKLLEVDLKIEIEKNSDEEVLSEKYTVIRYRYI